MGSTKVPEVFAESMKNKQLPALRAGSHLLVLALLVFIEVEHAFKKKMNSA
jgi:hypothetical protein